MACASYLVRVFYPERKLCKVFRVEPECTVETLCEEVAKKLCRSEHGAKYDEHVDDYVERFRSYRIIPRTSAVEFEASGGKEGEILEVLFARPESDIVSVKEKIAVETKEMEELKLQLREAGIGSVKYSKLQEQFDAKEILLKALNTSLEGMIVGLEVQTLQTTEHHSGFLRVQQGRDSSMMVRYWFTLESDGLHFRNTQNDSKLGCFVFGDAVRVRYQSGSKQRFSLTNMLRSDEVTPSEINFEADSNSDGMKWLKSICKVAQAQVDVLPTSTCDTPQKQYVVCKRCCSPRTRRKGGKKAKLEPVMKITGNVVAQTRTESDLKPARPIYVSIIQEESALRELLQVDDETFQLKMDGEMLVLKSAQLDDLIKFFILESDRQGENNTDLEGFLMCYYHYCTADAFFTKVTEIVVELRSRVKAKKCDCTLRDLDKRLFNFLEQCVMAPGVVCERGLDAHFRERALSVAKQLLSPVASLEMLDAVLEQQQIKPLRPQHESSEPGDLAVFEFSDFAIAAQLTYWEADMFRKLHVAEFLDTRWQKKKELAPNLLCLVAHFNKISFWVAGSILELDSTKEQCRLFKKFVRIAKALLDLRNYSTCMQIISGLTDKSIVRLKRLKGLIPDKYVESLETINSIFRANDNFRNYRTLPVEYPRLPVIALSAVTLRDVVFILDNPLYVDEDKTCIGIERLRMLVRAIYKLKLNVHEATDYSFLPYNAALQTKLEAEYQQDGLYKRSLEVEPRKVTASNSSPSLKSSVKSSKREVTSMSKAELTATVRALQKDVALLQVQVKGMMRRSDDTRAVASPVTVSPKVERSKWGRVTPDGRSPMRERIASTPVAVGERPATTSRRPSVLGTQRITRCSSVPINRPLRKSKSGDVEYPRGASGEGKAVPENEDFAAFRARMEMEHQAMKELILQLATDLAAVKEENRALHMRSEADSTETKNSSCTSPGLDYDATNADFSDPFDDDDDDGSSG